jgi:hypothetical protein
MSTRAIQEKSANKILSHIRECVAFMEQQTERRVNIIRSDNGLEYSKDPSMNNFKEKGILKELPAAYNPAGSEMVEG